ncbi:universal stress protein [Dactylosporangium vinaceum]|uniref:Universal stress protein n=1 Tax=Dactylosporangium vinaceum TaxID=53362 RepID=A0ABV5MDG5_9ACTN|nr:universal stress protein [Dactylosporangium vinaceum]
MRATILVGVDGTTSSLRAAAYAVGLARRQQCRLVAVYVRARPAGMLSLVDTGGAATTNVIDAHDAVELQLRTAVEQQLTDLSLDARLVVRTGEPFTELATVADQVQADSVIVGRSASAWHRFAGSVAVRLVRCGRWPVTVVP